MTRLVLPANPIADDRADVAIAGREVLAEGFRRYERLRVRRSGENVLRPLDVLRSGPAAAVLPIDPGRDEVVLLRQFRLAAHLANGRGNLVEIVAGHVETDEQPAEAARRECVEEIGVAPGLLVELFTYLTSPGMSDEEITLFLGVVDASGVPERAGAAAEHEETVPMRVPIDAALAALAAGTVRNGPLIIALQWLALNRGRLGEIVRMGFPHTLMGAILLAVTGLDPKPWEERFRTLAPQRDIRIWPDRVGEPAEVAYACAWHAPNGLFARFAHLKVIFSLGAGVDHVVADPHLPDVPVVRIVDADLTMRMTEYVVLHVLMHHRRQRLYDAQQRARVWRELEQSAASEVAVGVMGLGVLGRDAASALRRLGFRVAGWSRTPKTLTDVETFDGEDGLDAFLRRTEILVCLLPATDATRGVLNLSLLRRLKRDGAASGAYLINAGRGALQVDADIVAALEEGSLAGATLDVFPTEPLPATSPLWTHPKVTITPHNAAASDPHALVANILRQIERFEDGLPLEQVLDRSAGY